MNKNMDGSKPRLLVIGARGFLGTFVSHCAQADYKVIRADRSCDSFETDVMIDVAEPSTITRAFHNLRPDVVLLLAAMSDIDRCQQDQASALAVNVHGAEAVANACAGAKARLLFTSSGAVFNGLKHGYTEDDAPNPVSFYGETKARAESIVTGFVPTALVVRLSLVLGMSNKPGTNSLLDSLVRRWKAGEVISASVVESRNPIDASTLSKWLLELISDESHSGIFHTGSKDATTRFDLALSIAAHLGFSSHLIQPELNPPVGRAPRGPDHLLLTEKISKACFTQPPSCKEVIERSLNEVAEGSLRARV